MQITRREFGIVVAGSLTMACSQIKSSTSPSVVNQLQPLPEITNPDNGTKAILRKSGYATADAKLTDFLRSIGYTLEINSLGFVSAVNAEVLPYGWMFCVQNNPFGSAATAEDLKSGELWAMYQKQSKG